MNTDPRRGLPSAAERRRTSFRWNEAAERKPGEGESGKPASDKAMKAVSPAEQSDKPHQ